MYCDSELIGLYAVKGGIQSHSEAPCWFKAQLKSQQYSHMCYIKKGFSSTRCVSPTDSPRSCFPPLADKRFPTMYLLSVPL